MHGGIVNPTHITQQPLAIKLVGAFRVTETLTRRTTNALQRRKTNHRN